MSLIGVFEGRRGSSVSDRKLGRKEVWRERENEREAGPNSGSGRRRVCGANPSRFPSSDETAGSAFEFGRIQRHPPPPFLLLLFFFFVPYLLCTVLLSPEY
jgi:hypothetical protein